MIDRTTRLRWRRRFRRSRRQVEDMGVQAEDHIDKHFFRKLGRLAHVRRFVIIWVLLIVLLLGALVAQTRALDGHYLTAKPVPGGIYSEGILGSFTNANPLYATSAVDSSVSRLIFASLLKYDQNHQLVGDLAQRWTVDEHGTHYIVYLRKDLKWQDGEPLTADDIVFTYQSIQNPDAKSPLAGSWQGVTVEAINPTTVKFTIPNPLGSFPHSLTNGIVPKHLLSGIPPSQLRSISFNTSSPVGSGPFKWAAIDVRGTTPETREEQIGFEPNSLYYGGKPKLDRFIIRTFHNQKRLEDSFAKQELTAAAGLPEKPAGTKDSANLGDYNIPLLSEVLVFFKTSQDILKDTAVRKALTMATDTSSVINTLGYPVVPAKEPILMSSFAYDKNLQQLSYNQAQAAAALDGAGWKQTSSGIRSKDGKPLTFQLYLQNDKEYQTIANTLRDQWKAVGVNVELVARPEVDLQNTVSSHSYDALLYGIQIGADPDVFAYWHSSQANVLSGTRLNFSEYKSSVADNSLEAGRTRTDPTIRAIKYRPFLDAWRNDAPAIALYQPRFLYLTHGKLFNFNPHGLASSTDRYANVNNWMIREEKTTQ